jgi:hypothetical protein
MECASTSPLWRSLSVGRTTSKGVIVLPTCMLDAMSFTVLCVCIVHCASCAEMCASALYVLHHALCR